jgi:hypothetical protein
MRKISSKFCRKNQNTHFILSEYFPEIVPFMRKCQTNMMEPEEPQMAIWRRFAC